MRFREIEIVGFRNLKNQVVKLHRHWSCIYGKNAQGKSNLLEAISILANGRNTRDTPSAALRQGDEFWHVRGMTETLARSVFFHEGVTTLSLNGETVRILDFLKSGGAVYVDDNNFWKWFSFPEERRKFLDRLALLKDPTYLAAHQTFTSVLRQRNSALKRGLKNDLLDVLSDQLVESAITVNRLRHEVSGNLGRHLHEKTAGFGHEVSLYYPLYSRADYQRLDARFREKDSRKGFTHYGPQREDLTMLADRQPVMRALSLGQRKFYYLVILLCAAELVNNAVLVVDDFDTDLDGDYMNEVMSIYARSHVQKMTSSLSGFNPSAHRYHVVDGTIQREDQTV